MKTSEYTRLLPCPDRSFFLFGPRGTGKSTWLRQALPGAFRVDLLNGALYLELLRDPTRLEAMASHLPAGSWIVLDEMQKVPALLDEVHRLMETRRWRFALCGSSARKLRRGGANLLAGRAITLSMEAFVSAELRKDFDIEQAIEWGTLPFVHTDPGYAADILDAYVQTYLREEIREEGVVRNVPPFLRFLAIAGQMNGQSLNVLSLARDAAVARTTVEAYIAILVDTLIAHLLPAWRPGAKVREATHPKLYLFDPGVARAMAGLLRDPVDRTWEGAALETLLFHELRVYNECSGKRRPISFYRTAAGVEIDFVVESRKRTARTPAHIVALEVKRGQRWDRAWEKPLRSLDAMDGVMCNRRIVIYTGSRRYRFGDVEVLPVRSFLEELHSGNVF
jgi:predicted AAA+ superfamily ATPase